MASETIYKLQPNRTMQLRGFDRRGAAAFFHSAESDSFKVSGVFRDFADFAVLELWRLDNIIEHPRLRYLPDSDFTDVVLQFDMRHGGTLQGIDSIKNPWIAWDVLSYITADDTPGTLKLIDHAVLQSGSHSVASASWTWTGAVNAYDQIYFHYFDIPFSYAVLPEDIPTLADFLGFIATAINNYPWIDASPAVAIRADSSSDTINIHAARYGTVDTSGTTVTWVSGYKFSGLDAGGTIRINGAVYTLLSIDSPTQVTIDATAGTQSGVNYLADLAGDDGNMVNIQVRYRTTALSTSGAVNLFEFVYDATKLLGGGNSDVTWRVTLDFSALGLSDLRLAWLTFAPRLQIGPYIDTDWELEVTNWTVTDPSGKTPLKVAGPGSERVHCRDARCQYSGAWTLIAGPGDAGAGFYYRGFAKYSSATGANVTIRYSCGFEHDLYVGCELGPGRKTVSLELDGNPLADISTDLNEAPAVNGRRRASSSVPAGIHTLVITTGVDGDFFYFDYIEAAVLSDVPDPETVYTDRSPAFDLDTTSTYQLPPVRAAWNVERMGFMGPVDFYLGVFFWNNRRRVAGTNRTYAITFTDDWIVPSVFNGDRVTVTLSGIPVRKTLQFMDWDQFTPDNRPAHAILARSISDWINAVFAGVWCEVGAAVVPGEVDTVYIHSRTAIFEFTVSVDLVSDDGGVIRVGSLDLGSEGIWEVDPDAEFALNSGVRKWCADWYAQLESLGVGCRTALSMELLNPPERDDQVYAARYANGIRVLTDTGFGTEGQAAIQEATNATPIVVKAEGHGYDTGDLITGSGATGNTAVNLTRNPITVIDEDHFSFDGSAGNGDFTGGGRVVRNLHTAHCTFGANMVAIQSQAFSEIAELAAAAGLEPWVQAGEWLWWFFSYLRTDRGRGYFIPLAVANSTPIEIYFSHVHGMVDGDTMINSGYRGTTGANGTWTVTRVNDNQVALVGSVGNGAWVSGTGESRGGGMAYYDAETTAAATVALGRDLHVFDTQDDDPGVNSFEDAQFLQDRLKAHFDAVRLNVLGNVTACKFELLYALDVNLPDCYHTLDIPYPQGGRLNHYVNLPDAWRTKSGSGFDAILSEALSMGATYRNLDLAVLTMTFLSDLTPGWEQVDLGYNFAIFNGGCPWTAELRYMDDLGIIRRVFWAWDHFGYLEWDVFPLPRARVITAIGEE